MISFRTERFNDLAPAVLMTLQGLTNDRSRGDLADDGRSSQGSAFRLALDSRLMGEEFPHDCWVILAQRGKDLVGWCLVTRHQHGPDGAPLSVPTGSVGFYVHPACRRLGLASRLLEEASEHSRKNGIHRLLANPWNRSSLSFFQSNGFEMPDARAWVWGRDVAHKDLDAAA